MPRLRDFVLALFFAVLATAASRAQEPFPARTVKIVVPPRPARPPTRWRGSWPISSASNGASQRSSRTSPAAR